MFAETSFRASSMKEPTTDKRVAGAQAQGFQDMSLGLFRSGVGNPTVPTKPPWIGPDPIRPPTFPNA